MNGLSAIGIRVILRSLSAVEHPVITDNTNTPNSRAVWHGKLSLEALRSLVVSPRYEKR
jgi:hypothetical protein